MNMPGVRSIILITLAVVICQAYAAPPGGTVVHCNFPSNQGFDVYLNDIHSNTTARFSDGLAMNYNAVWSSDGKNLAFTSERDGNLELYSSRLDSFQPKRLTFGVALDDRASIWTDLIVFASTRQQPASRWTQAWTAV